jgi:hypothetical protein
MSYLYPSSLGGAALETTTTAMSLANLDEITIENTIRSYQHRLAEYATQGCHYSLRDVSNIDLFPPDNSPDTESSEEKRDTFKLNMDFVQGVLRIQLEIQESRAKLRRLQEQETNLRKIVAQHDTLISDLCRVYHSFQATAHVRLTESLDTSLQPLHHAKQLAEYELLACVQRIQYVQEWIATLHGSLCTVTDCLSPMGRGLVKNTTASATATTPSLQDILQDISSNNVEADIILRDIACTICSDRAINVCLNPCGHVFCETCTRSLRGRCFTCRTQVHSTTKMYFQ